MKVPRILAALLCCTYVLALLIGVTAPNAVAREGESSRDVVILLDVTVSMVGIDGDTPDIWNGVRDAVIDQIRQLPDGISFVVVPFTREPRLELVYAGGTAVSGQQLTFVTASSESKDAAAQAVASIEIPTSNSDPDVQLFRGTYICAAVNYAVDQFAGWKIAQGGEERTQNLYLYTDGLEDDPACQGEDFGTQLSQRFNSRQSELPYLYFVYVDLAKQLDENTKGQIQDGGGVVMDSIPASVSVVTPGIDLGNVAITPQASVTIQLGTGALVDAQGAPRQANLVLSSNMSSFSVDSVVTLAPTVTVTFQAPTEHAPGSRFTGTLKLEPAGDGYVFSPALIPLIYSWEPPATPTPTTTPIPEATATAIPPTATPEPTTTPLPIPTPTSVAAIMVERDDPRYLGELTAGSDDILEGTTSLIVSFDQGAIANNSSVNLRASIEGSEDATRFWLIDPASNQSDTTVSVAPAGQARRTITVGYYIPAGNGAFLPGSRDGHAEVAVTSGNASISTEDTDGPGDGTFDYAYGERTPVGAAFIGMLLLLAALLLLIAWVMLHARFPATAVITDPAGNDIRLRRLSEPGLFARLFRASELTVGPPGSHINLQSMTHLATLTPRRSALSFGSRTLVRPLSGNDTGFQNQDLLVNGQVVSDVQELFTNDQLHLPFQNPATYQQ